MADYSTNELRNGLKVMIDGDPGVIVDTEFVKPGKGQAFVRVKTKNLKTQRVIEKTLKSGEGMDAADVMETDMEYLYKDGDFWNFMNPDTFEQHAAASDAVGEAANWIKEGDTCAVTLYNGSPIVVTPPNFVTLEVTQTDPGVRGDTSSGGSKPATLETGAVVRVPLFIAEGELLKIDTRSGEYVSRAKE